MSRLVCLHGWGLHSGIWSGVESGMHSTCLVQCPDLPGYGKAPVVQPYDSSHLAHALINTWDGACVLCGWSMGGMVALAAAARYPDRVRGLILVGASPVFTNREGWDAGLAPEVVADFTAQLLTDFRATVLRFLALQARGSENAKQVIALLRQQVDFAGEPSRTTLAAGLELLRTVDLRADAERISCPTLIVHGDRDALCPVVAGHWLAEHIPGAVLAAHAKAAHAPFLSHSEWFLDQVTAFCEKLDG